VGFLSLDEGWKLLSAHKRALGAHTTSLCLTCTWSLLLLEGTTGRGLDAGDLGLLDGVNQLFNGFLQKVNFSHLALLILLDPCLDGVEPGLVQLLGLDEHLNPLLLLSLKILDDGLMVNQVLFVL
jgi:hypothetical protein